MHSPLVASSLPGRIGTLQRRKFAFLENGGVAQPGQRIGVWRIVELFGFEQEGLPYDMG